MWEPSDADDIDDLVRMEAEIMEEGQEDFDTYCEDMEENAADSSLPDNPGARVDVSQHSPKKDAARIDAPAPRDAPILPSSPLQPPSASELLKSTLPVQRKVKTVDNMAARLHAERKALFGDALNNRASSIHHLFEESQELITLKPTFAKIKDSRRWLHELPQSDNCKMITLGNQKRFYLHDYSTTRAGTVDSSPSVRLLAKSGAQLQEEIDTIKKQQLLFERTKEAHEETISRSLAGPLHGDTTLWVDKYSPKSFMQLLSPERINRAVLMAVKKWDKFVFKRHSAALDAPSVPQSTANSADSRPFYKIILLAGPPGTGKTTLAHVVASMCGYNIVEVNASDERSAENLQEIITRAMSHNANTFQAGSTRSRPNCIILDEVDGMDNNKSAIQHLIDMVQAPLLSTGSASDSNAAHEVDEESAADAQSTHRSASSKRPKRSSTNSSRAPVTRPILLICNNLYAPALMNIKKYCEVFSFSHASNQNVTLRIQQRLKHICQQENLGHLSLLQQPSFLNDLVVKSNGDIRSSIHALQFLISTATLSRPASSMGASLSGHHREELFSKDVASDSMMIWKQAFHLAAASSSTASASSSAAHSSREDSIASLLTAAMNNGDAQLITAGLFENLAVLFDNYLYKYVLLYEWFSDMDVLNQYYTSHMLLYENNQYQALLAGVVSAYYPSNPASLCGQRLTWPRKDKDAYYRKQQRLALAASILHGQTVLLRRPSIQEFIVEQASSLLDIVHPSLRAAPFPSLSKDEQARVREVAAILEHSGLRYVPDRSSPLASSVLAGEGRRLVLEPSLPLLVSFHAPEAVPSARKGGGSVQEWPGRREASGEGKEAVAAEQHRLRVALAAQRRRDPRGGGGGGPSTALPAPAPAPAPAPVVAASPCLPPSRLDQVSQAGQGQGQGGEAASLARRGGGISSFFQCSAGGGTDRERRKRPALPPTADGECGASVLHVSTQAGGAAGGHGLYFKFRQGYSNAVKRPVTVRDFLKGFALTKMQ